MKLIQYGIMNSHWLNRYILGHTFFYLFSFYLWIKSFYPDPEKSQQEKNPN